MSYTAMHNRLSAVRGTARSFTCQCGQPAQEWAYSNASPYERTDKSGLRYSISLDDYSPMCRRCHRRFDKAAITSCPRGHPYAGANLLMDAGKRKCRTCVYERNRRRTRDVGLTAAQKARKSELQRQRREARRSQA